MSHTRHDKKRLLNRVRRIAGQIEAVERALEEERECASVMQLAASARCALGGLIAELMEDHVRMHMTDGVNSKEDTEALIAVMRAYMR